jgi:hypothetical protein
LAIANTIAQGAVPRAAAAEIAAGPESPSSTSAPPRHRVGGALRVALVGALASADR